MSKDEILQIWEGFHWVFFVYIQGLMICLRRFENDIAGGNFLQAQIELETATDLIYASGAAMELAGSFNRQEYEHLIRPAMMPPNVRSENFSGLMSWDHASLIKMWKRLSPVFETLPAALHPQHARFVAAYVSLSNSHTAVCKKFGGDQKGSLRCNKSSAVSRLEKFGENRLKLIDPKH
ncbi:MAG: siderophore biosynthesis protein [Symploca sp. SIO2E9]|nr:siderophore biosynthesis protein [Symploca sp. SIO2E9]